MSVCLTLIAHAQSADLKYFLTLAEPLLQKTLKNKPPGLSQQCKLGESVRDAQQSVLHTDHTVVNLKNEWGKFNGTPGFSDESSPQEAPLLGFSASV